MNGSPLNDSELIISRIKRFGAMLVSTKKASLLLEKTGSAIQSLAPGAVLLISKPMAGSLRVAWQSGLKPYMNKIYTGLHGDPLHMAFPLGRATAEQNAFLRDNKLHHFKKGSRSLYPNVLPERLVSILDQVLGIADIHIIGFAWAKVHYATLAILLPKGACLMNKDAVETCILLASGALMRLEAENDIRQSAAQYRTLVEESSEAIGVSLGNRVVYANPALLKMLGYDSLKDLARNPLLAHIAPESRKTVLARIHDRDQKIQVPSFLEHKMIRKDGAVRTIIVNSREIIFKGEKCTQTSFQDVTEEK